MGDVEHVGEVAGTNTDDAALERVERRQTTEDAVRLAAVTRVEVVAGLHLAVPLRWACACCC